MANGEHWFDVVIIGGGPAGLAMAIWCAEVGLSAVVLEQEKDLGGQLNRIFNRISNYVGLHEIDAIEVKDRFQRRAESLGIPIFRSVSIKTADLAAKRLEAVDGSIFMGRAVVIATGVRRRRLGVPGEQEFAGRGILVSGVKDKHLVSGKNVVVVGGGDAAFENALILANNSKTVTLVHRREAFSARPQFVERAGSVGNITVLPSCFVRSIEGDGKVQWVEVFDASGNQSSKLEADLVLIRIGVVPNTELFADQLDLDPANYIQVRADCATGMDMVYAVGDVANLNSPTLNTATGMAATAAKNIERQLRDRE